MINICIKNDNFIYKECCAFIYFLLNIRIFYIQDTETYKY